jgi:acyl phosphate:glycerol-3-phosphate acyltransferase
VLIAPFMVAGYLAGSITFGYWLIRWTKGVDIRTVGSHNLGATNVWRTYGWRFGLPVMVLDILKAFIPTLVATLVAGHLAGVLTGAAAMVGHARPVFLRFAKGGKMVATAAGAFLGVAPLLGLAGAGVWLVVFVAFRYASLASLVAAASLAPLAWAMDYPWPVVAFGGAAAVGVAVLHRANIGRLLRGEENRFDFRRSRREARPPTEVPASR